jgi:hypothetical protein
MICGVQKIVSHRRSSNPNLTFLISFQIIQVDIELIDSCFLRSPALPIEENSGQPEPVTLGHKYSFFVFVHLESQAVDKVQAVSYKFQFAVVLVILKKSSKRIVYQQIDSIKLQRYPGAALSNIQNVRVCRMDLNAVER